MYYSSVQYSFYSTVTHYSYGIGTPICIINKMINSCIQLYLINLKMFFYRADKLIELKNLVYILDF